MKSGRFLGCVTTAAILAASMTGARTARAEEVSPTGKGIAGGALLGGEVVMLGEAAVGVHSGWALGLGALVGGGGGAYLGSRIESGSDPQVSLYMLAGGVALLIPATVAALQASAYESPNDYTEDRPTSAMPVADPARPVAPTPAAPPAQMPTSSVPARALHLHWHAPAMPAVPPGLLDLDEGALSMAVPAVSVRPVFSPTELATYGVEQARALDVPVLAGTF